MRKCYVLLTTHKSTKEAWVTGVYSSRKKAEYWLKTYGEESLVLKREIYTSILE